MKEIVIEVNHVSKSFNLSKPSGLRDTFSTIIKKNPPRKFTAINDVSFSVTKGEMIGIIGLNGSGKTTLLRTISGIYKPDQGTIRLNGKIAPLLQIGAGFHEELSAKDNIMMYGLLLGFSKKEMLVKLDKILEFAELEKFVGQKLKQYSAGMKSRLAFSTALQIDPDILLVDEILAVGDMAFKKKSFDEFLSFKRKNKTILYASHSIGMMPKLCDRVLLMNQSKMVTIGEPEEVIKIYNEITSQK